ncbi:MAG TPA: ABC transporter ATP-binding protein [Devosiaceae bacterium]|jgi:iron(III) transport system ATP-binding protein
MQEQVSRMQAAAVSMAGLRFSYGDNAILKNIDLDLTRGTTLALLGPSGCGKTTLLRLVAGLLAPTAGAVAIGGKVVADAASNIFVPPEKRGLGMVFQDYALWPHLSIGQNIAFPLEMRGVGRAERETRVTAALDRVGLGGFATRSPSDLSGGQQQRVAIARAIVSEPDLVLFDEPLSNLDRELRETMVDEIAQLMAGLGLTAIYVTHDQSEAFTLAHRVAVMRSGSVAQLAAPEDLVNQPASPEVAEFLKLGTIASVDYRDEAWWLKDTKTWLFDGAPFGVASSARVLFTRAAMTFADPAGSRLTGTVLRSQFRGDGHAVMIRLGTAATSGPGAPELQILHPHRLAAGEIVGLVIEPASLRWFPALS